MADKATRIVAGLGGTDNIIEVEPCMNTPRARRPSCSSAAVASAASCRFHLDDLCRSQCVPL
jgi:hypothetical protein